MFEQVLLSWVAADSCLQAGGAAALQALMLLVTECKRLHKSMLMLVGFVLAMGGEGVHLGMTGACDWICPLLPSALSRQKHWAIGPLSLTTGLAWLRK